MLAGPEGVADDRVFIDTDQACGLADAAAVLEVLEDGEGLAVREAGAEQGGTFTFGETLLAGATGEHAALLPAIAKTDAKVALAAQAVGGAVGVLAAEQVKLVHKGHRIAKTKKSVDNASGGL